MTSISFEYFKDEHSGWQKYRLDTSFFDHTSTVADIRSKVSEFLNLPRAHVLISLQHKHFLDDTESFNSLRLPKRTVLQTTDYSSLLPDFGFPLLIQATEQRGITIDQLRALRNLMHIRCSPGKETDNDKSLIKGWYDTYDEAHKPLYLEELNLYQANEWVIKPMTRADQGRGKSVPLLPHEVIDDLDGDAPPERPRLQPGGCSYVEAIAVRAEHQLPSWFVSHAWIEPVYFFVRCLEEHCHLRHLAGSTSFWVCAYANNQHMLDEDLTMDPRDSSFFRAMVACQKVVLLLDKDVTPFRRIWCCFEASVVVLAEEILGKPVLWDIGMVDRNGKPRILSDGVTEEDMDNRGGIAGKEWQQKSDREQPFPFETVLAQALRINIEDAAAAVILDRNRILNSIIRRDVSELDDEPFAGHAAYSRVNAKLHGLFAVAAWRQALPEAKAQLLDRLAQALREDTERKELRMNFQYSGDMNSKKMERLGSALPSGLERLTLNFDECHAIGNAGLTALAQGFGEQLVHLTLSFVNCTTLDDRGLAGLCKHLPVQLQVLHLDLTDCEQIGNGGLAALANALFQLGCLKTVTLNFCGCGRIGDDGLAFLAAKLGAAIETLDLNFMHCVHINNSGVASLAGGIVDMQSLRFFKIDLTFCTNITDAAAVTLVSALPSSLRNAELHLLHTGISRRACRSCETFADMQRWLEQMQVDGELDAMILDEPRVNHDSHTAAARPATPYPAAGHARAHGHGQEKKRAGRPPGKPNLSNSVKPENEQDEANNAADASAASLLPQSRILLPPPGQVQPPTGFILQPGIHGQSPAANLRPPRAACNQQLPATKNESDLPEDIRRHREQLRMSALRSHPLPPDLRSRLVAPAASRSPRSLPPVSLGQRHEVHGSKPSTSVKLPSTSQSGPWTSRTPRSGRDSRHHTALSSRDHPHLRTTSGWR
eukprot:TRINITY_DN43673_c0_g1_i1.p1 TRINITY_DN43673_c0_g1~~TRINITY_DN43673_c0_g1_i1.p1  ORF type:complete len:940 (-),score=129.67 TRINITY_DN43673_c0_g1_i1:432-3251(-)